MRLSRRRALSLTGALTAVPALAAANSGGNTVQPSLSFDHGIASGDPLRDRIVLWTRVSGARGPTPVTWQLARDDAFRDIAASGRVITDGGRDHTVKADATGLKPGTDYWYRFRAGDALSPVGRTRTLADDTDKVVLAVVCCALYSNGYFNAYRAVADLPEVDAVVHLGDYIYEYGAGPMAYGMGNGRRLGRIPEPGHDTVSLADYRTRHAQYKRDEDLQAAHARAPWICVFDDHEICDNPWKGGALNHHPDEGPWAARKAAAIKAYREWMPVRDPSGSLTETQAETVYRSFRFGKLAELVMVETRLLARSKQLDYRQDVPIDAQGRPDFEAFRRKLDDPARELFGATQRRWLETTLRASVACGMRWQVLGSQVVMARLNGPDVLPALTAAPAALDLVPAAVRGQVELLSQVFRQDPPLPLNLDAWDGYPAERERLYALFKASGARPVVVSGDSHCAWANQLHDASGDLVAVELGVTAVSSPTHWLDAWLPDLHVADVMAARNDEVVAADDGHNGFVRLTLTTEEARGEWMMLDTITSRDFRCMPKRTFVTAAADTGVNPWHT